MKKKMLRGSLIPDLTISAPVSYEALPLKIIKEIPIDPVKHTDSIVVSSTLKELKVECKKRKLPTYGIKSVLTKRIEAYDKKIIDEKLRLENLLKEKERIEKLRKETEHRRKVDEENAMVRRVFENKIKLKQSELKSIRQQVVAAYIKLRTQQNVCSELDKKAQEIRTTINALREG